MQIVHDYRDKEGKSKSKVIKSLGYLDELEKEYDNPITHFKNLAKQMDSERLEKKQLNITITTDSMIDRNCQNRKNYGHIVFSKVFHELQLDRFFNNKQRHENFKFNSNSIMKVLLFARLLYPCSKKATVEIKDLFFDKADLMQNVLKNREKLYYPKQLILLQTLQSIKRLHLMELLLMLLTLSLIRKQGKSLTLGKSCFWMKKR